MNSSWAEQHKNKIILVVTALVALFAGSFVYYSHVLPKTTIHDGVYIGELNLSGLTKDEAEARLKQATAESVKTQVMSFVLDDTTYTIPYEDLGYKVDIDKTVERAYAVGRTESGVVNYVALITPFIPKTIDLADGLDSKLLNDAINHLATRYYVAARNADVLITDSGEVQKVTPAAGRYLNADDARKKILDNVKKNEPVNLLINPIYPEITEEAFTDIDALLGEFTTDYHTSAKGRKANVALGSNFFNHMVVKPGENVSFLDTVGGITADNGFESAGVLVNGELEQGVGGGICQVSSTLYNALILADLQIDERYNHSRPIAYVDPGTDAAVVEGYKDLKFTNNTNHNIYLKAQADGNTLHFQVFGHGADRDYDVTIASKLVSVQEPDTLTQYTSKLDEGDEKVESRGKKGYVYATYKTITKDGESETVKIATSNYIPKDRVVLVGTGERDDDEMLAKSK
ncbi:VanW family protein [Peptoniphilus equinus]|uniref:VanW family protein n=1 Tax=Peptoniphilus equinus TaxID=3016343 RepID=A0ABY7QU96_9FIRM|nr:VanW family protein [Peptoniphilus equinus]WBW49468.1 VanW family protein [Peptoniphilus equinus]